jgi:hypothetical protein
MKIKKHQKDLPAYEVKRGAAFVLGLGTRVIPDRKKKNSKNACRRAGDFSS